MNRSHVRPDLGKETTTVSETGRAGPSVRFRKAPMVESTCMAQRLLGRTRCTAVTGADGSRHSQRHDPVDHFLALAVMVGMPPQGVLVGAVQLLPRRPRRDMLDAGQQREGDVVAAFDRR